MIKYTCKEIEDLLVRSSFDTLDKNRQRIITEHLEQCLECQRSQLIISKIKSVADLNFSYQTIQPNPEIRKSLLKNIRSKNDQNEKVFDQIMNFFNKKIPVYQILAATAAVIIMLFIFNPRNDNFNFMPENELIIASVDSNAINMNIIYQINIFENQNFGRNIQEDSVLARFITPSM